MTPMLRLIALLLLTSVAQSAPIERIWMTHATNDPSKIVIHWETDRPAPSKVEYGTSDALGQSITSDEKMTLHHVEIPLAKKDVVYHYRVSSDEDASAVHRFKGYSTKELRIAIVGDWGYAPGKNIHAILNDDIHLLMTVGDNVASLHEKDKEGTKAFSALTDGYRELFQSTPFMPILGNHDREITPRGPKPPAHAVYDVEASAFREFFSLPDDEWKWRFDIPEFSLRFLALDASHTKDQGTTWQTNHPIAAGSEQHQWYAREVARTDMRFVFTLNNEQNSLMRGYDKGAWLPHFQKSSAVITGYGYFAERAEANGLPWFNTCLKGDGDLYKDPKSEFNAREDNYLLISATAGDSTMKVEIKSLKGAVLDSRVINQRH